MKKFKIEIIIIGIITLLFSLYKIINTSFGYDTDLLILYPKYIMDSWLSLSRYSLVFFKYIFHLYNNIDLRLFNIITYFNVFIYCIIYLYFLNINKERNLLRNILSIAIVITSPILLEQYNFTLQSPEVSFGMILMMFSFITTYKFLKSGRMIYSFITFILLVLCFGIYQSFINLYVLGALVCIYKLKDYKKNIFKTMIIFIISFMCYYLISGVVISLFDIEKSSYLSSQIGWFDGVFSSLIIVLKNFYYVMIGKGSLLNLGYLMCFITLLLYLIRSKKISFDMFLLILIVLSPLLLNSVTGSRITGRSLFSIPFMMSFIFFEFYDFKLVKMFFVILLISQIVHCYLLLTSDYKRYVKDIEISRKIYSDCGDASIFYLYGIEKSEENMNILKGEEMGKSFFEWSPDGINVSDYRVQNFMIIHGMMFDLGDINEKSISFKDEYPNDGYFIKKGNKCYINFGN